MKVYVASRFSPEGIEAVREMHRVLVAHGHRITHDWTRETADGMEGPALRRYLKDCAAADVSGVMNADALVLMDKDNQRMRGAYVEFGIALGLGLTLVTVGCTPGTLDMPGSCIFFELPYVKNVATAEEAATYLSAVEGR